MAQRRALLAGCVAGSVLLHLGVLLSSTAQALAQAGGARGEAAHQHGVAVRIETAHRSSGTIPAPAPTQQIATIPASAQAARTTSPSAPPSAPTLLERMEQLPPTGAGTAAQAGDPDAEYLPSRLLTRGPAPQQSIDLFYPELAPTGHFRAVLTLFIDDQGVVQRVRIDAAQDSGLPAALEEATRQTFLRSAFVPGELDGRPVRSQLRIEVEFTTEPADTGTHTASR